jgi:hypothetical protein
MAVGINRYLPIALAAGKLLTVSNSLTLAGTDGTTMTFPSTSTTLAGLDIAQTFSATQTFSAASAINLSSTSATLAWGSSAGSNQFTITYVNASNSVEYRVGRDGSGSDHIFRNSGNIQARMKWGAANGAIQIVLSEAVALTAGGSLTVGYCFSSTANFGVFGGSGAPTISAAKGSIYLRSDGSTTNDRAYIASNSSGTWTAIVTVA